VLIESNIFNGVLVTLRFPFGTDNSDYIQNTSSSR